MKRGSDPASTHRGPGESTPHSPGELARSLAIGTDDPRRRAEELLAQAAKLDDPPSSEDGTGPPAAKAVFWAWIYGDPFREDLHAAASSMRHPDPDDAVQDAYLRALRYWSTYDPSRATQGPRPWLMEILRSCCRRQLRKIQDRDAVEVHDDDDPPDPGSSNRHEGRLALRQILLDCSRRLTERARKVFRLAAVEQHKQEEVGRIVGMKRPAVAQTLRHVRSKMRECLEEHGVTAGAAP